MDNCLASLLLFVEIKQKSQEKNKKSQNLGKLMKQYVEMDKKDDTGTYIYFSLIFFHKIIFTKKKISWKWCHEKFFFTYLLFLTGHKENLEKVHQEMFAKLQTIMAQKRLSVDSKSILDYTSAEVTGKTKKFRQKPEIFEDYYRTKIPSKVFILPKFLWSQKNNNNNLPKWQRAHSTFHIQIRHGCRHCICLN